MYLSRSIRSALLSVAAALLATHAVGQHALEIIPLRHRTAEQVLPALRALMEPGATLTGQGTQLIVRTSPSNLAELMRTLEQIDRPLRRLQVSVRFDDALDTAQRGLEAGGRVTNRGTRIDIRGNDSQSASAERVDQRVQVMDGGHAVIFTGQATPFREAATGFEVVPRLMPDGAALVEIAQRRETPAQQQALSTSVRARLGEWLDIGGAVERATREERANFSANTGRSVGSRRIWLKVEELRP